MATLCRRAISVRRGRRLALRASLLYDYAYESHDEEARVTAVDDPSAGPPSVKPAELARPVKLPERIAAAIVSDIVSQGLKPGDRLPIESVMRERFEVGRASIREALRILEIHG